MQDPQPTTPPHSGNVTDLSTKRETTRTAQKPKETDWPDEVWTAIRADFRTGLTYGKLSEIFGPPVEMIVRRKQRESWRKDLRHEVQAETLAALAVGTSSGALSDEDVVHRAAQQGTLVVQRHRAVLGSAIDAISALALDLKDAAESCRNGQLPVNMLFLGPKETLTEASMRLANSLARIVPLERKSFGLEEVGDERPFEEQLRAFHAAKGGKAGG